MANMKESGDGLWRTFGFVTKIKYGGVIGKIAALGIVYLLTLCVAVFFGRAFVSVIVLAILAALSGLIFLVNRIEKIFKVNPEMATLEGTEVIRYRQNELASKNHPPVRITSLKADAELALPNRPLEGDAVEEES